MSSYKNLRIVFMGTPQFAVASLQKLVEAGCNIVSVVTAPDKPAGRGMQLQQSDVKAYALQQSLPVLQPEKLKDPIFLEQLKSLEADLFVVVAFRMLPELVWNMPPKGTINLHGSLLPQYRGAAPIHWAIIDGAKETGVTTFRLKHEIDTGNMLLQRVIPIEARDTTGTLHDRMMHIGAELLLETVEGLAANSLHEIPQSELINSVTTLRHAPKIFTETCRINWSNPANEIDQLIRGMNPYPGAFTTWEDKKLKIWAAEPIEGKLDGEPGKWHTDKKTYLHIEAGDGLLNILELQAEGKKRMPADAFLRGIRWV